MVGQFVPARKALGLIRKVVAEGLSTFDFERSGLSTFDFEQSGLSTFYFLLKAKTIATIPQRPRGGRVIKEDPHRINDKIRGVQQVRLIGDNVEQGIYSFQQAMKIADDLNLDLVEIAATANPPVCRVIDAKRGKGEPEEARGEGDSFRTADR